MMILQLKHQHLTANTEESKKHPQNVKKIENTHSFEYSK